LKILRSLLKKPVPLPDLRLWNLIQRHMRIRDKSVQHKYQDKRPHYQYISPNLVETYEFSGSSYFHAASDIEFYSLGTKVCTSTDTQKATSLLDIFLYPLGDGGFDTESFDVRQVPSTRDG